FLQAAAPMMWAGRKMWSPPEHDAEKREPVLGKDHAQAKSNGLQGLARATSELHADFAIQRIRPAAAERDREAHQAPEQRVFVPALEPREAGFPIDAGDDQHFDRSGRGPEAREQAQHDAYSA